jgi:hypothetical protein
LYTDLFVDQFFIDVIGKCSSDAKAIEYETNGQWKPVGEEKPSRRAQREKEAYKAALVSINTNGKSTGDIDHSPDDDSDDERLRRSKLNLGKKRNKIIFIFSRINRTFNFRNYP